MKTYQVELAFTVVVKADDPVRAQQIAWVVANCVQPMADLECSYNPVELGVESVEIQGPDAILTTEIDENGEPVW